MFKIYSIALIFLVMGCKQRTEEPSYPTPSSKEECYQLFIDILEVQRQRDVIREDFNITLTDYSQGLVSKKSFNKEKKKWFSKEAELRDKATLMYDVGYKSNCFSPVVQFESKEETNSDGTQ